MTRERSWKRAAIPRERGREKGVKEDDRRAREPGSDELARRFAFSHSSSCFSSPSLSPLSAVMPAFTPPPAPPPPPPPRRGRREPRCELWILLILLPLVLKELPVPETVTLTPPSFQKQKRKTENKKNVPRLALLAAGAPPLGGPRHARAGSSDPASRGNGFDSSGGGVPVRVGVGEERGKGKGGRRSFPPFSGFLSFSLSRVRLASQGRKKKSPPNNLTSVSLSPPSLPSPPLALWKRSSRSEPATTTPAPQVPPLRKRKRPYWQLRPRRRSSRPATPTAASAARSRCRRCRGRRRAPSTSRTS